MLRYSLTRSPGLCGLMSKYMTVMSAQSTVSLLFKMAEDLVKTIH